MGISVNKMTNIVKVEGIGKTYADKLVAAGIRTTEKLLDAGCKAKAREELAAKTGIPAKLILEWVNLADLMRIKGVGEEYSDLLEEAGVDTIAELANRKPENLLQKIMETNEKEKLVRRPPVLKQVQKWVEDAKKMPHKVEY
jgi:predicted flap endonuclease-1-like 5' DNA nuclease